jgi:hypothetical protein
MRKSIKELKYRYNAIKDGLNISDENTMKMLIETKHLDDEAIERIIKMEGEKIAIEKAIYDIENLFLSEQNIDIIYEYKDVHSDEWDFLNKDMKKILRINEKILKDVKLIYLIDKAELMIMRKAVLEFVENRKNLKNISNIDEVLRYIINNYTYIDTLKDLGYKIIEDKDNLYLEKYILDEETLKYK